MKPAGDYLVNDQASGCEIAISLAAALRTAYVAVEAARVLSTRELAGRLAPAEELLKLMYARVVDECGVVMPWWGRTEDKTPPSRAPTPSASGLAAGPGIG